MTTIVMNTLTAAVSEYDWNLEISLANHAQQRQTAHSGHVVMRRHR